MSVCGCLCRLVVDVCVCVNGFLDQNHTEEARICECVCWCVDQVKEGREASRAKAREQVGG